MFHVSLVCLDSFYDNSLALDYLVNHAEARAELENLIAFKTVIQRNGENGEVAHRVIEDPGDLVGFNTYVWNIEETIKTIRDIKKQHPHVTVVLGGMEATYRAATLLTEVPEIDFVIVGEGEIPFSNLLVHLLGGRPFRECIAGLAYRDIAGEVVSGGQGPIVQELDAIPSPFLSERFRFAKSRDVLYESYRGCAFSCGFCLYHRDYTKQRYFSLERVASDLRALREAGCRHIRFVDSTFNLHRDRTKNILRHLAGIDADVSVEVSAEFFDVETIAMLPKAGIRHVDIGLQSTNRDALVAVNRKWYRETPFKENLRRLRDEQALTLNLELIAGLPSDNYERLKQSIDEAVSLWPDHVSVYRLLGLKGTDVERRKDALGLRFSDQPPYELLEAPGFSPGQLEEVDLLTFAHLLLFNLGIGRYALRFAVDTMGARPTVLYEQFHRFVIDEGLYGPEEARSLGRYYAHGNRFDRPLPDGLAPLHVADALKSFSLRRLCAERPLEEDRPLVMQLIDYGYQLALLDEAENRGRAVTSASDTDELQIAPWCRRAYYSPVLFRELARQGNGLGEMRPEDVASVVFFIHSELGQASLALDRDTTEVLDLFSGSHTNDTRHDNGTGPFSLRDFSGEARNAVATLRDLHVLIRP